MTKRISNHNKSNCSVCNPKGGKKNLSGKSDLIVENSTPGRLSPENLELPNNKLDIVKDVLAESKELSERQTLLKKAKLCVEAFKYTYPDASNEEVENGATKLMEMPGHFLEKLVEQNKKREKDLSQAHTPKIAEKESVKESIGRQTKELSRDIINLKEALLKEVKDSSIDDLIELENKRYRDEWNRLVNKPFQPKESTQEQPQPKVIAVPAAAVTSPVPSNITWDPNYPHFYTTTTTTPNYGIPFFYKTGDTNVTNVGNVPLLTPTPNFIINSEPIQTNGRILPTTTVTSTVASDSTDKSLSAPKAGDPINLNTFGSILGNLYQAFSIPFQNFINDGYIR